MRRTPEIEEQIRDLESRLEALKKQIDAQPKPVTFTPGPWTLGKKMLAEFRIDAVDSNFYGMASTYWTDEESGPYCRAVAEANARLIAEAPKMFEVLERLVCSGDLKESSEDVINAIIGRVRGIERMKGTK